MKVDKTWIIEHFKMEFYFSGFKWGLEDKYYYIFVKVSTSPQHLLLMNDVPLLTQISFRYVDLWSMNMEARITPMT